MPEIPDFEIIQQLMEFSQATFKCLRSGECCHGFEILSVPGYDRSGQRTGNLEDRGRKPSMQSCRHLEPAQVVDGKWQPAACKIHDDPALYPEECKSFTCGFGPCALGSMVWEYRKNTHPEAELPDETK